MKKLISVLLALLVILSLLGGMIASGAGSTKNTGIRHEVCTSLSTQAFNYYTGSYTWEKMSELSGVDTDSSVEAAGSPLFSTLQRMMKSTLTHTVSYKSLTGYWATTDSEKDTNDATLIYSDMTSSSYNREHVWPKSHGNFYESGAGSDLHHLRPADTGVNSTRNHWTFGNTRELTTSYSTKSYGGKTVLWYNSSYSGNNCLGIVEPKDDVKGDIARILLYVYVTYGNKSANENLNLCTKTSSSGSGNSANTGDKIIYDLDTLLDWCEEDPVDTWEMSRNDCCQNIQGNRNVFIDYPEYAWLLFGRDIPKMYTPSGIANDHEGGPINYTLNVVSEDTSKGTVSGSRYTYYAEPADGFYTSGWTLTPPNAATVTQDGDKFTISKPTADCTLTIRFAAKEGATIRFAVPEGVTCKSINGYMGDEYALPAPDGVPQADGSMRFIGWVTAPVDNSEEKPTYLLAGTWYELTEKETVLYALYSYVVSDGVGDLDEFVLSVSVSDGDYVIAAPSANAMMNNSPSGYYLQHDYAAITNNIITNAKESNVFTIKQLGQYYTITDFNGAALRCTGEKQISLVSGNNQEMEEDLSYLWAINIAADGKLTIASAKSAAYGKLQYNANSPRFSTYISNQTEIRLYGRMTGTRYYTTLNSEPIKPCEHSWDDGHIARQATCVDSGLMIYTCTICSATRQEDITALGHDIVQDAEIPATCTTSGLTAGEHCNRCNYEIAQEETPALGHNYVDGACTICGEEDPNYEPLTPTDPCENYLDIDRDAWYHGAVDFVISRRIMGSTRTDALTFEPSTSCTRSMIVMILYNLAGSPETSFEEKFPDVEDGQWYTKPIMWAYQNGIVSGYDNGYFGPNDKVTREQIAVVLMAYAENIGKDTSKSADLSVFPDGDKATWSKTYLSWAVAEGLVSGKADNGETYLDPQGVATRAEVAALIRNFTLNILEAEA